MGAAPTWPPHTKLSLILEILKFLNYSYFDKIMTRKQKIGNLTNSDWAVSISGVKKVVTWTFGEKQQIIEVENLTVQY